jgi:quinol monooxygenase YgiN
VLAFLFPVADTEQDFIAVFRKEKSTMAHVIARLKVKDYNQWEKAFAAKAEARKAKGCERVTILRDPADRNSVVLLAIWATVDTAKAFLGNPELKQYMKDVAGVVDGPHITVYEDSDVTRTN